MKGKLGEISIHLILMLNEDYAATDEEGIILSGELETAFREVFHKKGITLIDRRFVGYVSDAITEIELPKPN